MNKLKDPVKGEIEITKSLKEQKDSSKSAYDKLKRNQNDANKIEYNKEI